MGRGYEQERRELAKKWGVDPYTSNPILAKKLDQIAWVSLTKSPPQRLHPHPCKIIAVFGTPLPEATKATSASFTWLIA
jgi:hypothetical protein